MPEPGEHPMHQELKAEAARRRAEMPSEVQMRSGIRARLHAEIDRAFRRPAQRGWLGRWWPGLVFASAVLALVYVPLLQSQRKQESDKPVQEQMAGTRPDATVESPLARAVAPPQADGALHRTLSTATEFSQRAPDAGPLPELRWHFHREPLELSGARKPGNVPPGAILTSFELQQQGTNIRLLDADGSVYTGSTAPVLQRPLSSPSPREGAVVLHFQVSGTNQTLNRPVRFSGQMSSPEEFPPDHSLPWGAPEVRGSLVVGEDTALPIRARSVER